MGLEAFDNGPDYKGGRPKGSTNEEEDRSRQLVDSKKQYILTDDKVDNEWYWVYMYEHFEYVPIIAHKAHTLPQIVKVKLDEFGIEEYDDIFSADLDNNRRNFSSSANEDTEDEEESSLMSAVDYAKK